MTQSNITQKMKLELVKEVDQFGKILYSIEKDGFYQSNTVLHGGYMTDPEEKRQERYNEATLMFNDYVKKAVYEKTREVVQSVEI